MRRNHGRATEEVGGWGQLTARHSSQSYARGALIYTPEQPADDVVLLSSGQLALHLISDEGRALTLRVVEPGQLCGQIALAPGQLAKNRVELRFGFLLRKHLEIGQGLTNCSEHCVSMRSSVRMIGQLCLHQRSEFLHSSSRRGIDAIQMQLKTLHEVGIFFHREISA